MLSMEPLPEVKLVRSDDRQTAGETKFGGLPTFVCGEIKRECCGRQMELLGQLDTTDFPELEVGIRLMVYVFICRECLSLDFASALPG
jgi:hypothetical protein